MAVWFGAGSGAASERSFFRTRVLRALVGVTMVLSLAGMAAAWIKFEVMSGRGSFLTSSFIMAYEGNVPTLYSYFLLNLCCVLLLAVSWGARQRRERWWGHWFGLAVGFFLMGFDEAASVHEKLVPVVQGMIGTGGWLHFGWVVPAGLLVLGIGLAYLRFLAALTGEIRLLVLVSAALYVGGALLIEMPEGAHAALYGQNNFTFHAFSVIEEMFEMLGLSLFSCTLLRYLNEH